MGRDNPCAAKLPVDPRPTSYKPHLLRIDFASFHPLLHLFPKTNKNQTKMWEGLSSVASLWHVTRKQMPRRGSQTAVAQLSHKTSTCSPSLELPVAAWKENPKSCCNFLFLRRRHWRPRSKERGTRH